MRFPAKALEEREAEAAGGGCAGAAGSPEPLPSTAMTVLGLCIQQATGFAHPEGSQAEQRSSPWHHQHRLLRRAGDRRGKTHRCQMCPFCSLHIVPAGGSSRLGRTASSGCLFVGVDVALRNCLTAQHPENTAGARCQHHLLPSARAGVCPTLTLLLLPPLSGRALHLKPPLPHSCSVPPDPPLLPSWCLGGECRAVPAPSCVVRRQSCSPGPSGGSRLGPPEPAGQAGFKALLTWLCIHLLAFLQLLPCSLSSIPVFLPALSPLGHPWLCLPSCLLHKAGAASKQNFPWGAAPHEDVVVLGLRSSWGSSPEGQCSCGGEHVCDAVLLCSAVRSWGRVEGRGPGCLLHSGCVPARGSEVLASLPHHQQASAAHGMVQDKRSCS